MRILNSELKNKTINYDELLKYGFIQENGIYFYKTKIYDDWITIKLDDSVKTETIFELIDNSYNLSLEK